MAFGICPLSAVAVRSSAYDTSEMVSQLLFGELVEILETKSRHWLKIRNVEDQCVGWVSALQIKPITPSEMEHYRDHYALVLDYVHAAMAPDHFIPILLGSRLPSFDGLRFTMGELNYQYSGQAVFPRDLQPSADLLLKIARRYLNAPYLLGGRSPMGIDAAALVQIVFRFAGIMLPREAELMVPFGDTVDFVEQCQPCDLAFFENRQGRIEHVGIVLPDKQVMHAYGRVRIDSLDHFGVYVQEYSKYTHKLRVVKRLLKTTPNVTPLAEQEQNTVYANQFELF